MISKKQLQRELDFLESKIDFRHIITNNSLGRIENNFKDIEKWLSEIEKKQNERWEMLKNYLNVKEEAYAELEFDTDYFPVSIFAREKKPVKKTRLIPIKKGKK